MAAPSTAPPQPAGGRTRPSASYLLAGFFFCAVWAIAEGRGDLARYLGALTMYLIVSTVIAYITAGRKGDWRAFSRRFFWLGLLVGPILQQISRLPPR